jgi:uncharacterized membrane protein
MTYYPGLFDWWALSISFSVVFMTLVAIFLYSNSRGRRRKENQDTGKKRRLSSNFFFVWVLLGLLVLYIASINIGSYNLFAVGNVVIELILIVYLIENRS